jgi:tetratricopeptide (TPR) repeat protein
MARAPVAIRVFLLALCGLAVVPYGSVIAAAQPPAPTVSKSIAKQIKAAQDAISQKQYDAALAQVKAAQSVTTAKTEYDNYAIDALLLQIYVRMEDRKNVVATLESIVQSPYLTEEERKTFYLDLAKEADRLGNYDKALKAAQQATQHGATEAEVAGLIATAQRHQAEDQRWRRERRISETQPRRRDAPLRYLNISDDEVREIQAAVAAHPPYDFVSIGGVVTGCPAEEGTACTDQVWVDLHRQGRTSGLLLSRVNNQWVIGLIQQWHLCDDALSARRDSFRSYDEYRAAKKALFDSFPSCTAPQSEPTSP